MSRRGPGTRERFGVCARCLSRSILLSWLAGPLDYCYRDRQRLFEVLALDDDELIQALGGRRRDELHERYAALVASGERRPERAQGCCRHDARFPDSLRFGCAPRALFVAPSLQRLSQLTSDPVVALVGSSRASDYGLHVARSLARGLSRAGVTVVADTRDGICAAALAGAKEVGGATLCALPAGLERGRVAGRAADAGVQRPGCVVAEQPPGSTARRWAQAATERVIVGLAQLTIVVEAESSERELAAARLAETLGRVLAAVPGRVTSQLAGGSNALLAGGARLVRDAQDALELLSQPQADRQRGAGGLSSRLTPALRGVLRDVSAGRDTPDLLLRDGRRLEALLDALSELELMGLLVRGDGGRYLPSGGP